MRLKVFIPLRLHSVYSRGKGALTLEEAASWVAQNRLPAAALVDEEKLYGWGKWRRMAEEGGFKPLFGCEVELGGKRFLFLVKTGEGYWNLMGILNRRQLRNTEGLVVIFIPRTHEENLPGEVEELRRKDDFYLGCDFSNGKRAFSLGQNLGLPLVWANPLKFVRSPKRLILLHAIHRKIPFPPERERLRRVVSLFGPDQEALALKRFGPEVKKAFTKTLEIVEKCAFSFEDIVPPLPQDLFPVTLREKVLAHLRKMKNLSWRERERAQRELVAVEESGFAPYFLVVHDVVEFARTRGILHNLKGSGTSSYLTCLLGISHINPLEFDLYFERFLNRGRPAPPDFDLDFDSRRRDEVLTYVLTKYGEGKTGAAFVCSLKNYRGRSALYETARAFGLPPEEARALAKKIPVFAEPDFLQGDTAPLGYAEIWRFASELRDVFCEISLHVGGVILTPAPVSRYLPLEESAKGLLMSQYDREAVEDLKLIKLDLLSVRGLAAISETKRKLNLCTIPSQDAKVYRLLAEGKTIGCFQVESPAMMNLLRRMKPRTIHELTQALALIRPGPTESGMKEALLRAREGKAGLPDPLLGRILPETEGILLYEEQVMQIAERVAGMLPEEGDLLRRSLKKKRVEAGFKERFFQRGTERGYTEEELRRLWETMEKFSSYSFNKAHSASYAHMAYQAVYLKAHHPVLYLVAVLNAGGGYYTLPEYIEEAKRLGIGILAPDINRSGFEFEVEGEKIRVGFTSIKGLGLKTAMKIVEERKNGEFSSIEDFLSRVHLTKAELLSLIKAGVFDSLEPRRARQILRYFQGLEDMEEVADLDSQEKTRMLLEALGFCPHGDPLALFLGKRPALRIKDLANLAGQEVELLVRVVDARDRSTNGRVIYFFLFEDETGLVEGVSERRCLSFGSPPVSYLRGEVRGDGSGGVKIFNCSFLSLV